MELFLLSKEGSEEPGLFFIKELRLCVNKGTHGFCWYHITGPYGKVCFLPLEQLSSTGSMSDSIEVLPLILKRGRQQWPRTDLRHLVMTLEL